MTVAGGFACGMGAVAKKGGMCTPGVGTKCSKCRGCGMASRKNLENKELGMMGRVRAEIG
jgi:hypothetical protein